MPADALPDFLISYHTADRVWMEWIAWHLHEAGYSALLHPCDHPSEPDGVERMQGAMARAERTVVVLSPDYLASGIAREAGEAACARDPTGARGLLISFRVEQCAVEELPEKLACVDLVGLNYHQAAERLLAAVGGKRRRSAASPHQGTPLVSKSRPLYPGLPPRIWNVPFARNPHFVGRDQLLTDLRSALARGRPVALVQGFHGPGGVGKRQLAFEYAYRYGADYDAICWVSAHSPATLRQGFAGLARDIGLANQDQLDQPAVIQAVLTWFQAQARWLLVLENASEPADVAEFLPREPAGHILITSRHAEWAGVAETLEIPVLSRQESAELLGKRTPQRDLTVAEILASELGNFPLALAQVGGYVATNQISIAAYRDLYRTRRNELWKSGAGPEDYPRTIATTLDLSLRKFPEPVAELLRLCAYLGPAEIPLRLFSEHAGELQSRLAVIADHPEQLKACVGDLASYALLEATGETVWVHPLLQTVIDERLPDYAKSRYIYAALRLLNAAFKAYSDDPCPLEPIAPFVAPALAVLDHAQARNVAPDLSGKLANRLGLSFRQRGNLVDARQLLEQAVAFKQRALPADHPTVATIYSSLGLVEQDLGNLPEALRLLQKALAINLRAYAPDHPTLATGYSNLALVERALGNDLEAERLIHEALDIYSKARVPDHPDQAECYYQLALVEHDLGKASEASLHMRKACAIRLVRLGEKHPATQAAVEWLMGNDAGFRKGGEGRTKGDTNDEARMKLEMRT